MWALVAEQPTNHPVLLCCGIAIAAVIVIVSESDSAAAVQYTRRGCVAATMAAPPGRGGALVRSVGRLLERSLRGSDSPRGLRLSGMQLRVTRPDQRLRQVVPMLPRALPGGVPWGCRAPPERGFLSAGDGDEESGLAKHFEEDRVIGHTPQQVFDVVAGVDTYADFVPWCLKSKVLCRKDNKMDAELEIGFKVFVENYISHVELKPPDLIKTTVSQSTLFDFLNNEWHFKPGPTPDSCHLFFVVDFQFKSALYRKVANIFFSEVQARLVDSFEERCKIVYGPSVEIVTRKKK